MIGTLLGRNMIASLLRASHVARACLKPAFPIVSPWLNDIAVPTHVNTLSIATVFIFGRAYLREIQLNQTESQDYIVVGCVTVAALHFATGTYELRALRVVFEDGSLSPWAGSLDSECWYGSLPTQNLTDLRVLRDVSLGKHQDVGKLGCSA